MSNELTECMSGMSEIETNASQFGIDIQKLLADFKLQTITMQKEDIITYINSNIQTYSPTFTTYNDETIEWTQEENINLDNEHVKKAINKIISAINKKGSTGTNSTVEKYIIDRLNTYNSAM
jgi:hypothetical protein